ncbi:MAG: malonyl-ACP O-methyltransferase BioC [Pseudomonadota bacterium]
MTTDPNNGRLIPDQRHLRRQLEQAASSYENAAFLQREVADRMFSRLEYIKLEPSRILDAGCRTGNSTRQLASRYNKALIVAMDIAQNMLRAGRNQHPWWKRHLPLMSNSTQYLCGNLENLPLAANSIDLAWSNLALQWFDLERSIAEAHRVVTTGGLFMFSTFGPDTLKELRNAFSGIDQYEHVNRFIDMHDIGDVLVHAGFADPVMDMEIITVTFDDLTAITRDLKSLGERNHLAGRRPGLMAPKRWQEVKERYESFRREGKLPVTIEVIYGHAWKPQPKSLPDGRQIIQFRDYPKSTPTS